MRTGETPVPRMIVLTLLVLISFVGIAHAQGPSVDFGRDIQPLFARRCFACHGPDEDKGGLRLNKHEAALAELDSGDRAIVPGKPDESVILERIATDDASLRMPPKGKPLSAEEMGLIRRWIAQGAKWTGHWAFEPLQKVSPPEVRNKAVVRNPIDAFIIAKLEQRGLTLSAPAEKVALLRRITFDITGLPPNPAEVAAFVADESPDAYERVVDRLLASPRYGERWARHWLDVVRFAETNSYERDGVKPHAWRFRDYVIRSFNDDKPYDQFVREQLAGDELPTVTSDSLIATGFYRLGLWDDEPADRLLAMYEGLDDIITTTAQGFLGLTVNCARCHDHKIDPIPQADYYSLLSFFRGITPNGYGPNVEQPVFANNAAREAYAAAQKAHAEKLNATQSRVTALEQEFRNQFAKRDQNLDNPDLDELESRFYRDTFNKLPDFDSLKPETVAKLEPAFFDIRPATREDFFGFVFVGSLKTPADGDYTFVLDSDDGSRLVVDGREVLKYDGIHGVGQPKLAKVTLKQGRIPIRLDYFQAKAGKGLSVMWSGPGFENRYLSATTEEGVPLADRRGKRKDFTSLIKTEGARVLGKERHEEYSRLTKELDELKRHKVPADYALCVSEVGPNPPESFVLARGNPQSQGAKVEPAFLSVLGGGSPALPKPAPGAKTSGRRLALANWIVSPDNRQTSRVMVNRIWQHHFGRGIVRSPNNFGQLGDRPTHPELLDWLASEFVRDGWQLKPLHKLIVMSNAYRQASLSHDAGAKADPNNDLFWRFNPRRLSAEEVRDTVHATNGRLNLTMHGPGFYPTISAEVLAGQSVPGSGWGKSSPEEQARRAIYIHVKRSLITPFLSSFDFPETDGSCEARFITTQPGQSLAMLNGEFPNQQAAAFAERLRREASGGVDSQVALALLLALSREPTPPEIERGLRLIDRLIANHGQSRETALNNYCLFVLNLNEFVYVD
ncbi:MAG: DUF1549 domain-containing protein [Planctomycetales bacterium]|nr:DUF1549 domain-containing protein [Planctomycetales bacterium]